MDSLKNQFQKSPDFKPYISSIVFPYYKNIVPNSVLTLDFPLTLLIGANGTNKSSILHALYGSPKGKSTGEYWFATHIDPIDSRPSYFYRYEIPETKEIAEVIKTIIKKKLDKKKKDYDPDYWEPSRPITASGMAPFKDIKKKKYLPKGRSKTRWNTIEKEVLYLDFRSEISAFDKAFYKDSKTGSRPAHRNILRKRSKPLKKAIDDQLNQLSYYGKERVKVNYTFTNDEKLLVSSILDNEYSRVTYIEHDFYLSDSFSVFLGKGADQNYSEAFAGSGETSVVRLVYALETVAPKTLILLDEPETSLHIKAQYKLQEYIISKIKEKHLQVVISTHSPFFAKNLPNCAIKVLSVDSGPHGKVRIINSAPAQESSFHLGYRNNDANKINIYVEDKLAKAIVERARDLCLVESIKDRLTIQQYTGGSSDLINMAGYEINKSNSHIAFLFDGDCKPDTPIPHEATIPSSKDGELYEIIKSHLKHCPSIPCDSNNENKKIKNYRKFIEYAIRHFRYLPFSTPEEFLIECHPALQNRDDKTPPKDCIYNYVKEKLGQSGEIKSHDILTISRQLLMEIPSDNPAFKNTAEILRYFTELAPSNH